MTDVNIRRTIEELIGDRSKQEALSASPEDYFAGQGINDIPGELIGRAFVHYSDSATIEGADAVAGVATRYSDVPLSDDDLPDHDPGTDPFATIRSPSPGIESIDPFVEGDGHADTSEFVAEDDEAPLSGDDSEDPDSGPPETGESESGENADFGAGRAQDVDHTKPDDVDDPFFEDVTTDTPSITSVPTEDLVLDVGYDVDLEYDRDLEAELDHDSDDGYSGIDPGDFDEI